MFDNLLISKKEVTKFKVSLKNPLGLTCEKITQTPRVFTTVQVKGAIENIVFVDIEQLDIPELCVKAIEYLLKDFFLYMHQTGLYNRQFKLWRTLGNIRQVSIFKPEKGFFRKRELSCYVIDLFIDEKTPCAKAIIQEDTNEISSDFKTYLSWILSSSNLNRLKGVVYFINYKPKIEFLQKVVLVTDDLDPISKYESIITDTKDVRLNVISYEKEALRYDFKHIYPNLKQ